MAGGMKVADLFGAFRIDVDRRSVAAVDAVLGKVRNTLLAVASIAGVMKFAGMIKGVADLGDHLDELSQVTGASVTDIQEFGYAADQAGVGLDATAAVIGKLSINMTKAAAGGKKQAEAFATMGVKVKGADGKLRPALDVLGDMADHFKTMPDGADKQGLAFNTLGNRGRALIPVLNQGREKLAALAQEFKDSGAEISGPDAASLGAYNDEVGLLHKQWEGVKVQIALGVLPTLRAAVKAIGAWFKANRAVIRQRIEQFLAALVTGFKVLAHVIGTVARVVDFLAKNWQMTLTILGAMTAAVILLGNESVIAALKSAAAWVSAALPLVLLAALIAAVVLVVQDLYSWFKGGDSVLKDWLAIGIEYMKKRLMGAIADVRAEFEAFLGWLSGKGNGNSTTGAVGATGVGQRMKARHQAAYGQTATRGGAGVRGVGASASPEQIRKANESGGGLQDQLFNEDLKFGKSAYNVGGVAKTAFNINQATGINVYIARSTPDEAREVAAKVKEVVAQEFGTLLRQTHDAAGGGK